MFDKFGMLGVDLEEYDDEAFDCVFALARTRSVTS